MDYFTLSKNLENGGRTIEHEISVDMAKHFEGVYLQVRGYLWKATENSGNVVQKCHAQKPVEPSFSTR